MGEDPKTVMAATAEAQKQQQQAQQQQEEAAKKRLATPTSPQPSTGDDRRSASGQRINAEMADRWASEMLPGGGRRQLNALNASGKADNKQGTFLHVPGVKRNYTRRRKDDGIQSDADESYVEIPDSELRP